MKFSFNKRTISYSIGLGFVLVTAFSYYANYRVEKDTEAYISSDVTALPTMKVGVVLGTSPLLANGMANPYFTYRIEAAKALYDAGKISFFILSGDNGREEYNEPEEMMKALLKADIPLNVIYLDHAGFRTFDSMIRAHKVFGQQEFIIISQQFHNERAVFIARNNGINAYGFNALDVNKRAGFKTNVREYFARVKVFTDDLLGVEPKFLGDEIEVK